MESMYVVFFSNISVAMATSCVDPEFFQGGPGPMARKQSGQLFFFFFFF